MRGESHLLRLPARSGLPTTPPGCQPSMKGTVQSLTLPVQPCRDSLPTAVDGRARVELPAKPAANKRGTDRHGMEPDDEPQDSVPGPRHKPACLVHLGHRGRNDLRLDWRSD